MATCSKCGAPIADDASFCGQCGQATSVAAKAGTTASATSASGEAGMAEGTTTQGMAENVAGLLCYVLGWVTGLIFFLIDKRPFVRFHATQSIVLFGGLQIIYIFLTRFLIASFAFGGVGFFSFGSLLITALDIVVFVLWIILMVKASQGERFRVPIAADLAERIFGKS